MQLFKKILVLGISALFIGNADADVTKLPAVTLSIEAQPLGDALTQFATQSGLQVVFYSEISEGVLSPALSGTYSPQAALHVMLANTALRYEFVNARTVVIRQRVPETEATRTSLSSSEEKSETRTVRLAEGSLSAETYPPESDLPNLARRKKPASDADEEGSEDEQMVVTGTQIRGAAPIGSPVLVFTQEDFDKAGAATAEQFLSTLPQNFGGGRTRTTTMGGQLPGQSDDGTFGSEINLRGLGSGSTLVLVNGRRRATGGALSFDKSSYVDISMIPLSAVERVEVLLDGASAVYGSDAVGGVVNFILRKNYRGAQTTLRTGTTTRGGGEEVQAAQTLGVGWGLLNGGSILLNYEYYKVKSITLEKRPFVIDPASVFAVGAATPIDKSQGFMLNAQQSLSNSVNLMTDLSYVERDTEFATFRNDLGLTNQASSINRQYDASIGADVELGGSWLASITAGGSRSINSFSFFIDDFFEQLFNPLGDQEHETRYVETMLSGDLVSTRAGAIKFVLGANYRDELSDVSTAIAFDPVVSAIPQGGKINSRAAFVEFMVPVLGSADGSSSAPTLALSVAGRYDDYRLYGDSVNPKVGVRWVIRPGVTSRASFSTSFKAPTIAQLDPRFQGYQAVNVNSNVAPFLPAGATRVLQHSGNNPNLGPESATNWTVGFDFEPAGISGLKVSLTAFDIQYKDRILTPGGGDLALTLSDPAFATVRTIRGEVPDTEFDAQVASILALPESNPYISGIGGCSGFTTPSGVCQLPVAQFGAIVESVYQNLALTHDRGIDVVLSQQLEKSGNVFDFDVNATWLAAYDRQVTSNGPTAELADTIFNPPHLRFRFSSSWQRNAWAITNTVHFTDGYTNNSVLPSAPVSSWSTMDVNMRYHTGNGPSRGWFNDMAVMFDVSNVFDRDPPFAEHGFNFTQYYDPANANPYGRTVSLAIRKSW